MVTDNGTSLRGFEWADVKVRCRELAPWCSALQARVAVDAGWSNGGEGFVRENEIVVRPRGMRNSIENMLAQGFEKRGSGLYVLTREVAERMARDAAEKAAREAEALDPDKARSFVVTVGDTGSPAVDRNERAKTYADAARWAAIRLAGRTAEGRIASIDVYDGHGTLVRSETWSLEVVATYDREGRP